MNKLKMQSSDIISENVKKIAELFPHCVTERLNKDGKEELVIDFDKLKDELSPDLLGGGEERYQFTWPNKRKACYLANIPTTNTLRPSREESINFDTTQNLYIEGDNLDVLKCLRTTYLKKIKMIYIDPPYNTGKDFVYTDNFTQDKIEYLSNTNQFDNEGNKLVQNTESNGRFHTDWLNMIYPRLKIARDLLTEDGIIFISISNNELFNLKKICDEIYGEKNFITNIVWTNKEGGGSSDSKHFIQKHEYILVYGKNKNLVTISKLDVEDKDRYKLEDEYVNIRGKHQLIKLDSASIQYSKSLDYEILAPDGTSIYPGNDNKQSCWRWSKEKLQWGIENGFIVIKKDKNNRWAVYTKQYLNCDNDGNIGPRQLQPLAVIDKYSTTQSNKKLSNLLNKDIFNYSKPTDLIKLLCKISTTKNEFILDFFSGSATTAHAVMQLNAEDGGNRKFIMVQLPEKTKTDSEAFKAGYKNICEIGKERIRRAGIKIKEEFGEKAKDLDIGFRVLKLDSSNMLDVFYNTEEISQESLNIRNFKEDRSDLDLLFQVMLEHGIDLSAHIEEISINNKTVFKVNSHYLLACFDDSLDNDTIEKIAKMKPYYFVMLNNSVRSDDILDNFEQIFKQYSKNTECEVI